MISTLEGAVVVPQHAVVEVQDSYQLAIVDADGKAEIRPVQVGPRVGKDCAIASDLKAGEKVIVEGVQKVKSGRAVAARQWTPPVEKGAAPIIESTPIEKKEAK